MMGWKASRRTARRWVQGLTGAVLTLYGGGCWLATHDRRDTVLEALLVEPFASLVPGALDPVLNPTGNQRTQMVLDFAYDLAADVVLEQIDRFNAQDPELR